MAFPHQPPPLLSGSLKGINNSFKINKSLEVLMVQEWRLAVGATVVCIEWRRKEKRSPRRGANTWDPRIAPTVLPWAR